MANKRRVPASSARAHTRGKQHNSHWQLVLWLKVLPAVIISVLVAFVYKAIQAPAAVPLGTPGGLPVTAPRVKLRDGRHLAYHEGGVPKETAKYKVITLHGFTRSRRDLFPASKEVLEQFGIYLVGFDRPGYGQSDPHPKRTIKSSALDVEQLADALNLGKKFYLISTSMGGVTAWACLKYIQHRVAGVAMEAPVVNFWWDGFPPEVAKAGFDTQRAGDRWGLRVTHYAPWLNYWWMTQGLFPKLSALPGSDVRTSPMNKMDLEILSKLRSKQVDPEVAKEPTQQGLAESLSRDAIVSFGKWPFSPLHLQNPYIPVHVWQGDEDYLVPAVLQRYIAQQLPWLDYHELKGHGHVLSPIPGLADKIVSTLFNDKMEDRGPEID